MTVTDNQGNVGTKVNPTKGRKRGPNRKPVRGEPINPSQIPERKRAGFWGREFDEVLSKPENRGKTIPYRDVSATATTTLKKEYGVQATTRKENGVLVLYATYDPAKAEEVKAKAHASAEKRSAAHKNRNGAKAGK